MEPFLRCWQFPQLIKKFPTFYRTWFITHLQEPVTACILSQINPVHIFSSCALKSHFNIILPPMPGYSKWSLSHRFSHQNPGCTFPPHICSISCLSHSSWFHHPSNVWWGIQITKLIIIQFSVLPVTFSLSGANIFISTLFSKTLSLCSSHNVTD
jgi:hypothetical protein